MNEGDDKNELSNKNYIEKNKYIIPILNNYLYDKNQLIESNNNNDLICPICLNILENPINCSSNKNSHSYCKKCIDKYLKDNKNCFICKNIFEYKYSDEIIVKLNKLKFNCFFSKQGCNKILNYS